MGSVATVERTCQVSLDVALKTGGPSLPSSASRLVPELKTEIPLWLENWKFDRFVTLATNGANLTARIFGSRHDRLTGLLEEWDGRMNRKLAGPKWSKRPEDRMWAFYFLEKPAGNPHWHGLVRLHSASGHARETRRTVRSAR